MFLCLFCVFSRHIQGQIQEENREQKSEKKKWFKGLCVCVCFHTKEELNGFIRTQISKFSVKIRFRFSVELCLEYN